MHSSGHAHGRVLGHRLPPLYHIGDRVLIAHVAQVYADIGAVAAEGSNIRVEEYDFAEISRILLTERGSVFYNVYRIGEGEGLTAPSR